jgi:hypothetical protein
MNVNDAQNQLLAAYVARDNLLGQVKQTEDTIRDLRNFIAGAQVAGAAAPGPAVDAEPSTHQE